jgi:hypothetical protein
MRIDEEFARSSYQRYLRNMRVEGVLEDGKDPPDYTLSYCGVQYAVEVTRVVANVHFESKKISKRAAWDSLERMRAEIENKAREEGEPRGWYYLRLVPIEYFWDERDSVVHRAVEYVKSTEAQDSAPRLVLSGSARHPHWYIKKVRGDRAFQVLKGGSQGTGASQVVCQERLSQLISGAFAKKEIVAVRVGLPMILLLVDDFHFCNAQEWQSLVPGSAAKCFREVARVYGDYECQVLTGSLVG